MCAFSPVPRAWLDALGYFTLVPGSAEKVSNHTLTVAQNSMESQLRETRTSIFTLERQIAELLRENSGKHQGKKRSTWSRHILGAQTNATACVAFPDIDLGKSKPDLSTLAPVDRNERL